MRTKQYFWTAIVSEFILAIIGLYLLLISFQNGTIIKFYQILVSIPFIISLILNMVFYIKYVTRKTKHKYKKIISILIEALSLWFVIINIKYNITIDLSLIMMALIISINSIFFMKYTYTKLQKSLSGFENLVLNILGAAASVLSTISFILSLVDVRVANILFIIACCTLIATYYKYIEFYYKNIR